MLYFRRSRFLRLVILPLTLLALLPACHSYSRVETTVGLPESLPSPARFTLTDGRQLELEGAQVRGDSIIGMRRGSTEAGQLAERVGIHISTIEGIERKKNNSLLVLIPIVVGLAIVVNAADPLGDLD